MSWNGGIYGGDDEPRLSQHVPPNSSFLLCDSNYRDARTNPMPSSFDVNLTNSGAGARRILHRNLQWQQSLYWHNMGDWQIKMSFSKGGFNTVFNTLVTPFTVFKYFAGVDEDEGEYLTPLANSYCGMLQAALRQGFQQENGTPIVPADDVGVVSMDSFNVRYSRTRGLVIYLDQDNLVPPGTTQALFRVELCSWMTKGHNVHGFGTRFSDISDSQINYKMEDSIYATGTNVWFGSQPPLGGYSRFFLPVSREICRNRKITTFTNLKKSGVLNATELTVIPFLLENQGKLKNYVTKEDPTSVNLRSGDNLQSFQISLADEFGDIVPTGILPGNPIGVYLYQNFLFLGITLLTTFFVDPIKDPNTPIYDKDLFRDMEKDRDFFVKANFHNARMDQGSSIVHYFEVIMF